MYPTVNKQPQLATSADEVVGADNADRAGIQKQNETEDPDTPRAQLSSAASSQTQNPEAAVSCDPSKQQSLPELQVNRENQTVTMSVSAFEKIMAEVTKAKESLIAKEKQKIVDIQKNKTIDNFSTTQPNNLENSETSSASSQHGHSRAEEPAGLYKSIQELASAIQNTGKNNKFCNRDYRLTKTEELKLWLDRLQSKLKYHKLQHVIKDTWEEENQMLSEETKEELLAGARDAIISRIDSFYHKEVIDIKDPREILRHIKHLRRWKDAEQEKLQEQQRTLLQEPEKQRQKRASQTFSKPIQSK